MLPQPCHCVVLVRQVEDAVGIAESKTCENVNIDNVLLGDRKCDFVLNVSTNSN